MTPTTVRRMNWKELDEVLAVTARAFWKDPLFDYFTKNLLAEYRLLPDLFAAYFKDIAGAEAEVWTAEIDRRPRAVAGWIRPGGLPRTWRAELRRDLRALRVIARCQHASQAIRLLREVESRHPTGRHWYLSILATDPTAQGRGLGTDLLQPVLRRCDEEGIMAYTETQKVENVSWYRRARFEVAETVSLGESPTVWCLRRNPLARAVE